MLVLIFLSVLVLVPSGTSQTPSNCKYSVVGGGYGGVYYAYRLTLTPQQAILSPTDFCIFEMSKTRLGGRVYSYTPGNQWEDLNVEMGAYRFQTSQELMSNLNLNILNATTTCWNGDCDYLVFRDPYGNNKGYVNGIRGVLQLLYNAGMPEVFMGYELVNLLASGNPDRPIRLVFGNGITIDTTHVLLNIPSASIRRFGTGNLISTAPQVVRDAIYNTRELINTKQYIWYDDAWWISKLNKTGGSETRNFNDGTDPPQITAQFLDGPVKCKTSTGEWSTVPIPGGECKGALECVYQFTASSNYAIKYFPQGANDAAVLINTGDPGSSLLASTHSKLMQMFQSEFESIGINPETIQFPTSLTLSHWNASFLWNCPAQHYLTNSIGIPNLDLTWTTRNRVLMPVSNYEIFLTNEEWGGFTGWGEGSLVMAERLLAWRWKLGKLPQISDTYYTQTVTPYMPAPLACFSNSDCIPQSVSFHSDPCLSYTCINQTCVTIIREGAPCDDGNLCTTDDICRIDGSCQGFPVQCEKPNICVNGMCTSPDPPALPKCSYHEMNSSFPFHLYWEYENNNNEIRFAFSLPGRAYIGIGFGHSMTSCDMILGWVQEDGTFYVEDYWSTMATIPNLDTYYGGTRDVYNTWGTYINGITTIYFQRKLRTGDIYDTDIIPQSINNFIYAFNTGLPGSLTYHAQYRGQLAIDLSCDTRTGSTNK